MIVNKHRLVGLLLVGSMLAGAGCSQPTTTTTTSPSPATTTTTAGTPATPTDTGTPTAAGTPAAADPMAGYEDAEGLPGFDEVKGLTPPEATPESVSKGKELFATNCASCHGDTGEGGGPAAAALDPQPRNLTESGEYGFGSGELGIFRTAKYGVPDTGMAPWEGRMSDEELWDVTHFVRSIQGS